MIVVTGDLPMSSLTPVRNHWRHPIAFLVPSSPVPSKCQIANLFHICGLCLCVCVCVFFHTEGAARHSGAMGEDPATSGTFQGVRECGWQPAYDCMIYLLVALLEGITRNGDIVCCSLSRDRRSCVGTVPACRWATSDGARGF